MCPFWVSLINRGMRRGQYNKEVRKKFYENNPQSRLLEGARRRARERGMPCDITKEDIVIPEFCPYLGIPLKRIPGRQSDGTPSIDRIIPELGYVKGNIIVVSWRANNLKCNATLEELKTLVENLEKVINNIGAENEEICQPC